MGRCINGRQAQRKRMIGKALNTLTTLTLLSLLGAVLLTGGCSGEKVSQLPEIGELTQAWLAQSEQPEANQRKNWNVLLITLDTTRADHIGCYGHKPSPTPNIDNLARSGIIFDQAITPVPITLPAHATIMTGLNPFEHGVRGNGSFVLEEKYVTLAEVLAEQGYATGATVGAAPVKTGTGLEQGFDWYDDDFQMKTRGLDGGVIERIAEDVTTGALHWINDQKTSPFFHWAHYYDPHVPYDPPGKFQSSLPTLYEGEIQYMDSEIGKLISGLELNGLLANTWIILVGDHGEALGEHGEPAHGMLIYSATQHVPCIVIPPVDWQAPKGAKIRNRRIKEPVGLRDLAPMLVNALGYPQSTLPASGSSLLPLITGDWQGPGVVYMESLMPSLDYGWSEIRGVRTSKWVYIRAPEEELYDLTSDPTEQMNLYYRYPGVAERLTGWLDHLLAGNEENMALQTPDAATVAQLRSLGYMGGTGKPQASDPTKDPKKLMHLVSAISQASSLIDLNPMLSKSTLDQVLEQDADNRVARRFLGKSLLRLEQWADAEAVLRPLLEIMPDDTEIQADLVKALIMMDSLTVAEPLIMAVRQNEVDNPEVTGLYAEFHYRSGDVDQARELLKSSIIDSPSDVRSIIHLARLEMAENNIDEVEALAKQAINRNNDEAIAYSLLGEMLWMKLLSSDPMADDTKQKRATVKSYLEKALSLDPTEPFASFRLAVMTQREGNKQRAIDLYRKALLRMPNIVEAHTNLASLLLEQRQTSAALPHFRAAKTLGSDSMEFLISYGVINAMAGDKAEARAAWERALTKNPNEQQAAGIRQNLARLGE